jgi:hypothetical protein
MSDEPLATHDEFVQAESLAALRALYRERGFDAGDEAFLERAQRDWRTVALAKAREVTEPPPELPPVVCERDGVRFSIFGVVHGLVGGQDREYKEFVNAAVARLDHVLIENALGYFYPARETTWIPDFVVLGIGGSFRVGLYVGLRLPLLLWEGLRELFKTGRSTDPEAFDAYDYSPVYHAIDPETRRGLDEYPPLPSWLQIDYEMSEWDRLGWRAGWAGAFAIVPRSAFMAGFARGYAASRGRVEVALLVGDLHTVEIQRFLEDPGLDHPLFRAGQAWGQRSDRSRRLAFLCAKLIHLALAGLGGSLVIVPVLLVVLALVV